MKLVAVPAGKFKMGAIPPAEDHHGRAPVREAEITLPFWMATYEVSQKQWREIMGTTVEEQRFLHLGPDFEEDEDGSWRIRSIGDDFPIAWVNWVEAKGFCYRLTRRERTAGRLPEHLAYDLPTEAQWEYACRAGTTSKYWFGNKSWHNGLKIDGKVIPPFAQFDKQGREDSFPFDAGTGLHPLRDLVPNPFGLCNMHGGVEEWCRDDYKKEQDDPVTDEPGDPGLTDFASPKVVRPGGGIQDYSLSPSHERYGSAPAERDPWTGFRVVVVHSKNPSAAPVRQQKEFLPKPGSRKR